MSGVLILRLYAPRELLTGLMEKELFGRNGDQPKLTVEGYSNLCSKLGTVVSSLEQNIKALLKDYDGKKKVCGLAIGHLCISFCCCCCRFRCCCCLGGRVNLKASI